MTRGWRGVAVGLLTLAVAAAACGDDGGDGDGGSSGALPECAEALPLPGGLEVAEITAEPEPDNPTCAVTFASSAPIDEVVASWQRALDAAEVSHETQHRPGAQAVVRLDGPVCGSILVFAAGTERVTDAVAADRTPALASIIDCALLTDGSTRP